MHDPGVVPTRCTASFEDAGTTNVDEGRPAVPMAIPRGSFEPRLPERHVDRTVGALLCSSQKCAVVGSDPLPARGWPRFRSAVVSRSRSGFVRYSTRVCPLPVGSLIPCERFPRDSCPSVQTRLLLSDGLASSQVFLKEAPALLPPQAPPSAMRGIRSGSAARLTLPRETSSRFQHRIDSNSWTK